MPDPAPPSPAPAPPAPRTRRAGTILGRLSHAVREQNWFAVALEVLIVIVGVVIGFQVTAWGDERAARTQERELLRGLRAEVAANIDLLPTATARSPKRWRRCATTW